MKAGGNKTIDGTPRWVKSSESDTTRSEDSRSVAAQAGIGSELVTKNTPSSRRNASEMAASSQ